MSFIKKTVTRDLKLFKDSVRRTRTSTSQFDNGLATKHLNFKVPKNATHISHNQTLKKGS
ncbi:hypothetical protein Hanom_Chr16g01495271 [Helianthus anomalus]